MQTQQDRLEEIAFDAFRTDFLKSLYELYSPMDEGQERVYFVRLKEYRSHYKRAAEFVKDHHKGKTMPNLPRCMELVKIIADKVEKDRNQSTTVTTHKFPWQAAEAQHQKLLRDYMAFWCENSELKRQAYFEGWGDLLHAFVHAAASYQASVIACVKNIGWSAMDLFMMGHDDERDNWLRHELKTAFQTGRIEVSVPVWAIEECRIRRRRSMATRVAKS